VIEKLFAARKEKTVVPAASQARPQPQPAIDS